MVISMGSLAAAIWFVVTMRFEELKEWNNDYDDYTTAFKIFLIVFAIVPLVHEAAF